MAARHPIVTAAAEAAARDRARAVVLTELFPPAIGGSAELLANVYGRFGDIPVTVLTRAASGAPSLHAPGYGLTSPAGRQPMTIVRTGSWGRHWGVLHPGGLRNHVDRAVRLLRLSRRLPTVVHCARGLPEGLDAWAARRLGGAPYVCWAHGEELGYARGSREFHALMQVAYRGASSVIANSRNTAGRLLEFGVPSERISVVYPGVDTRRFRPAAPGAAALRETLGPGGELLMLTVGRLQRRKGHDLVLQALATRQRELPPCRYVIVGSGPEEARLRQLVVDLGLQRQVTFVGSVSGDELPALYAAADLFVHPNRIDGEDFEGFGIVFLEAAAAGLPIIAGSTGGAPEAIQDGVNGLLVSGADPEELGQAILVLASAPDRRRAMGAAGRARVSEQFSWERAASTAADLHRGVAGSPGV